MARVDQHMQDMCLEGGMRVSVVGGWVGEPVEKVGREGNCMGMKWCEVVQWWIRMLRCLILCMRACEK